MIYNTLGQVLYNSKIYSSNFVLFPKFSSGNYFVVLYLNDFPVANKKLIIIK